MSTFVICWYPSSNISSDILEFIATRKESLSNQIVFSGNDPIIYEGEVENNIVFVDESVSVRAAIFGEIGNAEFFYKYDGHPNSNGYKYLFNCISTIFGKTIIE